MTVEERQLLCAVRRVICRVQIDRDPLGLALQALAMALDHGLGECHTHSIQIRPIERFSKRENVGCEASPHP